MNPAENPRPWEPATDDDAWAWARAQPAPEPEPGGADRVVAVVVAHNGAQWLGRTLVSLARLRQRPGRLIAVDAGSTDDTRALLQRALDEHIIDAVVDGHAEQGFGANVALALAHEAKHVPDAAPAPEWLWLLHDDLEVRRGALTALLRAADPPEGPAPAMLLPKLLHPRLRNHPDQLGEVGETISVTGERITGVEPGDIDQKQVESRAVLGGSTAGMFVRLDAWERLGGLAPSLPLFRDGVELGWRANEAGLIVRTCPQAGLYHHQASHVWGRDSTMAPNPDVADRVAALHVVQAHSHQPTLTMIWLTLNSWGRALGLLLGKAPTQARDQLTALRRFRAERDDNQALRARVQAGQVTTVAATLLPGPGWGVRRGADALAGRVTDRYRDIREPDSGSMIDELTKDEYLGPMIGSRRLLSPGLLTMLALLVGTLVASRSAFGPGALRGSDLLPAPAALGSAWAAWTHGIPGLVGSSAPWLGVAALGSTATLGQPNWFALTLVFGGVALATLSARHYFSKLLGRGWTALVLAVTWGLLLPLLGLTSSGTMDATVVAISLPMFAGALYRWREAPTDGAEGLRAPGAAAVWLTLTMTAYPLAWVPGVLLIAQAALVRRDRRGGLLAAFAPLLVLASWVPRLAQDPGRLLTGTDPTAHPAGRAVNAFAALVGRDASTSTPLVLSVVVVCLLWLAGVSSFLLLARQPVGRPLLHRAAHSEQLALAARRHLWALGLAAGLTALGVLLSRLVVTIGGVGVRPRAGVWVLVALWGMLVLVADLAASRRTNEDLPRPATPTSRPMPERAVSALVLIACLLSAGWWLWGGAQGSLARGGSVLPSYVTAVQHSDRASRALLITLADQRASYALSDSGQPRWGTGESSPLLGDEQADALLAAVAQQMAQGLPSDDLAARLSALGVSHVWLRGASEELTASLASAPGLVPAAADQNTTVWTVTGLVSRTQLVAGGLPGDSLVEPLPARQVPAGAEGRAVVLAEPTDARLRASVDGTRLQRVDSGDWRQAFTVPASGGRLEWSMRASWLAVGWQVLGWVVLIVLAAPTARPGPRGPRRALSAAAGDDAARRQQRGADHD